MLLLFAVILPPFAGTAAFLPPSFSHRQNHIPAHQKTLRFLDSCSIHTAVEYFDGSQVVDPVVVSGAFWASLQTRILSFVVGQTLAAMAFFVFTTVASQQIGNLADWVSDKLGEKKLKVPPSLSKTALVQPDFTKLLICITLDIIGSSSELVPILGEVTDLAWAPLAAIALRTLYGSNVVLGLEFVEEILPFTDILPLATICWYIDTYQPESNLAKLLQLGQYGSIVNGVEKQGAIDIEPERWEGSTSKNELAKKQSDRDDGR